MKKYFIILLLAIAASSQEKPKAYTPTHEQKLELENAQLRAQLAQTQVQKAQENFRVQVEMLKATCKAVATENKWPSTVECDVDTLNFADKAQKAEPKK